MSGKTAIVSFTMMILAISTGVLYYQLDAAKEEAEVARKASEVQITALSERENNIAKELQGLVDRIQELEVIEARLLHQIEQLSVRNEDAAPQVEPAVSDTDVLGLSRRPQHCDILHLSVGRPAQPGTTGGPLTPCPGSPPSFFP